LCLAIIVAIDNARISTIWYAIFYYGIFKMSILIAGASGYIGKRLFAWAKKLDEVHGTSSADSENLLRLQLDAPNDFDYKTIKPLDVVLLTAAISAPDICAREHDRAWAVNVTGTSEFIAKVMARSGRVVFFSSDTVYGERDDAFDEQARCNPAGEYAEMKHAVEKQFLGNPLFKAIRLSYVFSREDKFTKYLSGCAQRGEEADIFHPFYRSIIHRDDVVQGAIALAQRWDEFPQSIINFGGPEVLARTEFAKILQDTVLPNLGFSVTEPDADFFKNRPKVIRMVSPLLSHLLGRPCHGLAEAAKIEFS
jgi:dTDP-4-dehydrorhamnose reductase